jgi:uncharacterized protein YcaQ
MPELPMLFIAPLDSLIWDRPGVKQIFGFEYLWEVYKPVSQRKWGYYVLPVFYRGRFVGRIDSQVENQVWRIHNWWWETDVTPDEEMFKALTDAAQRFQEYLGVEEMEIAPVVDQQTRDALEAALPIHKG